MDITTKTVTTRVHTAVATTDDIKSVAILAVKGKLGLSDNAILSADAKVGEDGSITVEVVESVASGSEGDDKAGDVADLTKAAEPADKAAPVLVPGLAIPMVIAAN